SKRPFTSRPTSTRTPASMSPSRARRPRTIREPLIRIITGGHLPILPPEHAMSQQPSSANRLLHETSPYLRQHAHNPVDWYPWGPEALERARQLDRPIFLSIGYSACHWCHVMEHESFEEPEIARILNERFVSIKVDREERPDLDQIYMAAVQLLNQGQGGWPMSVFLTPDLKPFFAGTYYPPHDHYGRPGFKRLITALADAWRDRRQELVDSASEVTTH